MGMHLILRLSVYVYSIGLCLEWVMSERVTPFGYEAAEIEYSYADSQFE